MTDSIQSAALHAVRVSAKTVWFFVVLKTRDGLCGYGEATRPGAEAAVRASARAILPLVAGAGIRAPAGFSQRIHPATIADAVIISAVDHALWDLHAQSRGLRLVDALRGGGRDSVALYANINRRTRDRSARGFAESARAALRAGHTACKIAPFDEVTARGCAAGTGPRDMRPGLDRIHTVREALGPQARLMVDCHWRFDEAMAAMMMVAAAEAGVYWIECPISETPDHIDAIARLRGLANGCGMRLAGLEDGMGMQAMRPFVEAGAYDVVMPDVKYFGGLQALMQAADWLDAKGVELSLHNPSGPVSHLVSLGVSAAVPCAGVLEHQFDESPLFDRLMAVALPGRDGGVSVLPGLLGTGAALDERVLAEHADSAGLFWGL